ncbi:MAG: hypothetical protein SOR91_02440 [Hornefia butyriciproducens]|uniref:hypothetical protein n=1 Tax=Hornefia butyriciproducens TaxID=2652293 RepID=UPI002A74D621|nr:hypothetical protein [Hornefia butyriciproducens]MCI7327316.1 hypothetical protein [Clostridiales bacterium]MDY2990326.1 hypothetical protein [Hornefia butyriciproducens]
MEKLSEKKISRALQDTEFFKTLEPAEMMYVLVSDIILRGDVKKSSFEYWLTQEERWPEISAEDRMDQVLRVLEDESPSAALQAFQKVGFMRFCMPRCFPIRKLMDKKTFYSIIDNFNQLEYRRDDLPFKLAVLMFSFDPLATEETLYDANFDQDAINWICNLIYFYMEFIRLNTPKKLKAFVGKFGKDFYFDMNDYAWAILKITKMRELKPLKSKDHVLSWMNQGVPLDAEDLELTREDILEAGAESEDEVTAIQQLLIEHCQKKPLDNIRELELSLVKNLTQKEIDRTIRRVRKAKERRY